MENWNEYVMASKSLEKLESRLNEWLSVHDKAEFGDYVEDVDTANMPTFGGSVPGGPGGADGVYSWDSSRLLVSGRQDGQPGWEIIPRTEATWMPEYKDRDQS